MPIVDTHVHVFARDLPMADGRRYAPDYDADVDDFLRLGQSAGVTHAVLVQPSFFGYDCSFMVNTLRRHPGVLRGIAVVPTSIEPRQLAALRDDGVVGIRLNLDGLPLPDFELPEWKRLLAQLSELDMQVELHRDARDLHALIPPLVRAGLRVVVDHFGRPDAQGGRGDPGFQYLLSQAATGRVWVKLSAAYRNGWQDPAHPEAVRAACMLLANFGTDRLVWGSDWPHTRYEQGNTIAGSLAALETWVPGAEQRRAILGDSAMQLFGFAPCPRAQ